ncbi:FUSC family protein [Pseudonocardia yunnanensis]
MVPWLGELRTRLTAIDPGLVRLRLAAIGTGSMALAAGVTALIANQPVTVVLLSAVLAMICVVSVNEPELGRLRVTTALMIVPACVAVAAGTLLAPHHLFADIVFVAVMVTAVYIRRFGPRGFALGMAAFNAYFFTQFLRAAPDQLPWLLLATAVGVASSVLLRGFLFSERPERTLVRQLHAFDARVHDLVGAVVDLFADDPGKLDSDLRDLHRKHARLNETALLVTATANRNESEQSAGSGPTAGDVPLRVLDAELSAERLAVSSERLATAGISMSHDTSRMLLDGLHGLQAATATGTPNAMVAALLDGAERSVATIVGETHGYGDRVQRVAFAVTRLARAIRTLRCPGEPVSEVSESHPGAAPIPEYTPSDSSSETTDDTTAPSGMLLTTRQAIQVGVATSFAIVAGELLSPSRWYWAVITAFLVFAGTTSRGEVLSRGWGRILGTIGGVIAGMGLALLVSGSQLAALILLFACIFVAIYVVQISPSLLAFWITAVLAILYGLIGQFSVATLVLRIEETALGAALGILASYLILPKRTREAFGEALDEYVDAVDAVLATSVDRILGRESAEHSVELAKNVHDTMATLRTRAAPLDSPLPWRRGRSSYHRMVQVLSAVDHYTRFLARLADHVDAPGWSSLCPAAERVQANLDGLRRAVLQRDPGEIRSAEDVIDAAESDASRQPDPHRLERLAVSRMLRRIDQAVCTLAEDLRLRERVRLRESARAPSEAASKI